MTKAKTQDAHSERISNELKLTGFTKYGMLKFATKYLPNILHEDEHIGGAVYGRYRTGNGILALAEGMLVATDKRVIFLDHKPGFTSYDEVTYDVVSGAKVSSAGFMFAVTLHTRVADYALRFANARCANNFVKYVERKRLEKGYGATTSIASTVKTPPTLSHQDNSAALDFLNNHHTGVLSTTDKRGNVYGAVVHYLINPEGLIYVLTKSETRKSHNIYANDKVALTVYDSAAVKTVQLQGTAQPETTQAIKDKIFNDLIKPRQYGKQKRLPPVAFLPEGSFTIIRVTPTSIKFSEFQAT